MSDKLSSFGKILINEVRDRTIQCFDMRMSGIMRDEESKSLSEQVLEMDEKQRELLFNLIPKVVDLSIHNMMCMIENYENIGMFFEEINVLEISDGLAGELYTEDGWIQRFSNQRYEE